MRSISLCRFTRPIIRLGLWSRRRWRILAVLAVAVISIRYLLLPYLAADPDYVFDFHEVNERQLVQRLAVLSDELQRIRDWQPVLLQQQRIAVLARAAYLPPRSYGH